MSLSFQKLNVVEVRDPRTIIENKRDYAILKSGSQTTWKQYSTTSVSGTSIQFSCPPPSGNVFTDRKQYIYLPVQLTFTGIPPAGQTLLQAGRDAPRAYPFSSACDTLQISINGQSVSINMADVIHALLHYNTDSKLKELDYSNTASCPDQSQQYGDLFGAIRNPLGLYGDSNDEGVMGRGGFPFVIVQNPVQNATAPFVSVTAIVEFAICEPLFLSPFYWGKSNAGAFYNVNTMDFNITFLGPVANRMWSHDNIGGTNVITSASHSFANIITTFPMGQAPLLFFQYITPQETQVLSPQMPISLPYFDVQRYPTDYNSPVTSGTTVTIQSNNIQLSSIPRRFYVYVRQRNQDLYSNASNADSYFQINGINIQFQNKSGLLSSANMEQLYQMSVKNHCQLNWSQWSAAPVYGSAGFPSGAAPPLTQNAIHGVGSVACIEFATDIGLDSLDAPGKLAQCMLQVGVSCTNMASSTITPTLYLVPILEGVFTIEGIGRASTNIGVITSQDILYAKQSPWINYKDVESVNGGDFFSGIKDFFTQTLPSAFKTGHDYVKNNKLISKGLAGIPHPLAQLGSTVANALGYGEDDGMMGQGVLVGGRQLSRDQLKRRLRR
jgi:hypothetical protein